MSMNERIENHSEENHKDETIIIGCDEETKKKREIAQKKGSELMMERRD